MGEPIRLWRGSEEVTIYGQAAAASLVAQGWQVGPRPADVQPQAAPDAPAMDEAPTPAAKPTPKRAGEYGSNVGTRTNVVDKTKQAEVKTERAKDKANK